MNRLADGLTRLLEVAIVAALALMVVLVFGNVVLRYGFNSGITVSEELSRWLFIWGTFLGAVIAVRDHAHLGVDMVVQSLNRLGKQLCLVVTQIAMLGICALLAHGSWQQTIINLEVTAPTTGWPMAIVYGAGLTFAVLSFLLLALDFGRVLRGRLTDDELVMVRESEEDEQLRQVLRRAEAERAEPPSQGTPR